LDQLAALSSPTGEIKTCRTPVQAKSPRETNFDMVHGRQSLNTTGYAAWEATLYLRRALRFLGR
jgi:hypothetical protein